MASKELAGSRETVAAAILHRMTGPQKIKTPRGTLTIEPDGTIKGLWALVRRELQTNEQVRKLCGEIPRSTLIRWRAHQNFPPPVLKLNASGAASRQVELWSRSDVEAWLKTRRASELSPMRTGAGR